MSAPAIIRPRAKRVVGTLRERFDAKWTEDDNGCWIWTASQRALGYGQITVDGRPRGAHAVGYELYVGPVPAGLELDHLCRNPACVNPEHLEPVTHGENLLRGDTINARNAAKTRCPQGHPYDEINTYVTKAGTRACRRCRSDYARARRAA